jgi:hypothetical protein
MKKVILLAAVAVMTTVGANAQGFEWGVKAGVNVAVQTEIATLPGQTGAGDSDHPRIGFYAGAFAEKPINQFLGIQAELLYSQMGHNLKVGGVSNGYKTDYISLPVLAKLYVWKELSLDLGPQFGYLISAQDGDGDSYYNDQGLKKFDMAFAAGLSYKIVGRYDVSARYNIGLTKLYDHGDAKNGVFSFGVGYRF